MDDFSKKISYKWSDLCCLHDKDEKYRENEITKCRDDFSYFVQKYIKIVHPMPFVLFDHHHKVIKNYEQYRFNIINKARNRGLTTISLLWSIWRCIFQSNQKIMFLSKSHFEARSTIDRIIKSLPDWLKPSLKNNSNYRFFKKTNSILYFGLPESARGRSITFLIIDEAGIIPNMKEHWNVICPCLYDGGSCVLIGTLNEEFDNWYYQMYINAKNNKNKFHIMDLT